MKQKHTSQRKKQNILRVPIYRQTLPTSCLPASMLMVGNFFKPKEFPLIPKREQEIHAQVRFWKEIPGGELGNFAKLIRFARKNNFQVHYFLEGPSGLPLDIDEQLGSMYMNSFYEVLEKEKKQKGVVVINRCRVKDILIEIADGRPVICEVKFEEYVTHTLVARGFEGETVYLIDPLSGHRKMSLEDLSEALDLGYMKNFLSLALP